MHNTALLTVSYYRAADATISSSCLSGTLFPLNFMSSSPQPLATTILLSGSMSSVKPALTLGIQGTEGERLFLHISRISPQTQQRMLAPVRPSASSRVSCAGIVSAPGDWKGGCFVSNNKLLTDRCCVGHA